MRVLSILLIGLGTIAAYAVDGAVGDVRLHVLGLAAMIGGDVGLIGVLARDSFSRLGPERSPHPGRPSVVERRSHPVG